MAPDRVDGDDGAFDRHHVEQRGNGDDFVGFFRRRDLPHDQTPARDEAALERPRVERGENVAQMVMRGRARRERSEPTQEVELFFAETRNVGKRLSPANAASRRDSKIPSSR